MNALIHTRFDLIVKGSQAGRTIARMDIPQIPNPGEVINIHGNPYVIKSRSWAASDEDFDPDSDDSSSDNYRLYAYVEIVKLGEY